MHAWHAQLYSLVEHGGAGRRALAILASLAIRTSLVVAFVRDGADSSWLWAVCWDVEACASLQLVVLLQVVQLECVDREPRIRLGAEYLRSTLVTAITENVLGGSN